MHEEIYEPPIVLIVDDDIPITEILTLVVESLGYQPLVAFNGQQALDLAREHWPALVLTDVMMPIMGGLVWCKGYVRKQAQGESRRRTWYYSRQPTYGLSYLCL
ncbi:hypothetical protein KSC_030920 [Ktedonobacter sp. SOSP1-52]|uniref:response regulator n=1 Tax=Ktedonobacter sp. SOSP1-52 TaxID=2778366 RepID=UPI001A304BA2|nr:response regulator [Ktedonobacter sp. SOSP1-52]GHO64200.1 hypothetical protein KSC_030920 [Ktedonobacter sp. SOSP1-52]